MVWPGAAIGDGSCPANLPRCPRRGRTRVSSEYDIWVEYREECVKFTTSDGDEEGFHDLALTGAVDLAQLVGPLSSIAFLAASWALRPPSRRIVAS